MRPLSKSSMCPHLMCEHCLCAWKDGMSDNSQKKCVSIVFAHERTGCRTTHQNKNSPKDQLTQKLVHLSCNQLTHIFWSTHPRFWTTHPILKTKHFWNCFLSIETKISIYSPILKYSYWYSNISIYFPSEWKKKQRKIIILCEKIVRWIVQKNWWVVQNNKVSWPKPLSLPQIWF